jgi:hypothetical protein
MTRWRSPATSSSFRYSAMTMLGLRWTRLRPGERRKTVFDNPGVSSMREVWKRIDLPPDAPGDAVPDED